MIVTREDILKYENSLEEKCAQQKEIPGNSNSEMNNLSDAWQAIDNQTKTERIIQDRLMDLRNSLLQSQLVQHQLLTPTKQCDITHDSDLDLRSFVSCTQSWNAS